MSILSRLFKRKKPPAPVEDKYDTDRESLKLPPAQTEPARLTVDATKVYNKSPFHKHDPLYNKKAYKAARAARKRMGLE